MYYPADDNELLYLIKDGNAQAYRMLYEKYEHWIGKTYRGFSQGLSMMYHDYKQECLLCLEKAIHTYNHNFNCSFFSFYTLIVKRSIYRLHRKNNLFFQEKMNLYGIEELYTDKEQSKLIPILKKELQFMDALEEELFNQCILYNKKIIEIANKFGVKYNVAYTKYKKIKEKSEKILTNLLV
ncbi:MAG: sigma-70 family RNA polymerase sigma factor [Acholeplasmatales bacterium]|jgi:DNA-directed RNA polymerase specialized sigma subunit|nr:sigma-70 family RNA polymerase sigma factor [Acholeplasmatales bacterium]MCI9654268.1 sigma-70 family RNA polymerase sigma factor [Acholeplasmatales bacterium]